MRKSSVRGRSPVIIVGMHRCGTSLVAKLVSDMGFDLGPAEGLMPPHPDDNPAGFFERWEIWSINELLLEALGGTWWNPPKLAPGWEHSHELESLRARARAELGRFETDRWTIKDPRMSITLPFWRDLIGPAQYIVCVRHPAEVAASLRRRSERPPAEPPQGYTERDWAILWMSYFKSALHHTAGSPRLVIDHRQLLTRGSREVARLADFLAVPAELRERAMPAIDPALWRQRAQASRGATPLRNRWMYRRCFRAATRPPQRRRVLGLARSARA